MIDYRELLIEYMSHVIDMESISFVDHMAYGHTLSEEDKKALLIIEEEARKRLL